MKDGAIHEYRTLYPNSILFITNTFTLSFPPFVADIISTVEFDHTGDYLATGDKGGRVVLFERNESVSTLFRSHPRMVPMHDK
jgi:hypothetical protein